ncbi:MAG: hypothetical protein V7756_08810 [Halopseudomonas sp.]|uniref:hypothetical protein n=1 Tax=Halopseudomonas sp. TaxID=2901191 RepID=UPI003001C614
MDYFIIAVAIAAALYFHWWLFIRIRRWARRDLALSMAGEDPHKRAYMLEKLAEAERENIGKHELEAWLRRQAQAYETPPAAHKN